MIPEDVKEIAVATLAHRLTLTPSSWASGVEPAEIVTQILAQVPGPATVASR